MRKFFLGLLTVAMVLPVSGLASTPVWDNVEAYETWDYGSYHVDRLKLPKVVEGPYNLGDAVVVMTVSTTCAKASCDIRDAHILRGGMVSHVPNVPRDAFDVERFRANEDRVVWATPKLDNPNRWDVVELDLVSGEKINLAQNVFMESVDSMKVMVSGDEIFLNPTFSFQKGSFKVANVYRYNPTSGKADKVTIRHVSMHEELLDIDLTNNRILTKMSFPGGEKQLWVTVIDSGRLYGMANRIVGTWTPKHEDIVAAHFRTDGSIEFFRQYERNIARVDENMNTVSIESTGHFLNWYRPLENSVFVAGDRMVWINTDDKLVTTEGDEVVVIGTVTSNSVEFDSNKIYFETTDGYEVYNLETGETFNMGINPNDVHQNLVVGNSATGEVLVGNIYTAGSLSVGYGTNAVISDEAHVYWRGIDGSVFQATIVDVSSTLGIASKRTLLMKAEGDSRVYFISKDGIAHWVVNEDVAFYTFGPSWAKEILEVDPSVMYSYTLGEALDSTQDLARF